MINSDFDRVLVRNPIFSLFLSLSRTPWLGASIPTNFSLSSGLVGCEEFRGQCGGVFIGELGRDWMKSNLIEVGFRWTLHERIGLDLRVK